MTSLKAFLKPLSIFFMIGLYGCSIPPFKPQTDLRIIGVSSGSGGDEIRPNLNLINANYFPFDPAVLQFQISNGVGVTIQELEINYTPAEGDNIVYQDSNGAVQTGIPEKLSRVQKYFRATAPLTELELSGATNANGAGTGENPICCIYVNLVTEKASEILSVDKNFLTAPNRESDIIANLTIRGLDDNDNPFTRQASILVSSIPESSSGGFDPGCSDTCSVGQKPASGNAATDSAGTTPTTSS